MSTFLLAGAFIGGFVGLLHAVQIFGERLRRGTGGVLSAAWFALWTMALWTVFGAYVLAFWVFGLALMALSRLLVRRAAP